MHPKRLIVTGSGTEVGKTVVSAILVAALSGAYWKPVECGESDTETIKGWLPEHKIYPPGYSFKTPVSPHQASQIEQREIDLKTLIPPETDLPLIIETAGGLLVPFNERHLAFDFFSQLDAVWIVVTSLYLGCINHTLLTLEFLKVRHCPYYVVFTGKSNPASESAILHYGSAQLLGRVPEEKKITSETILKHAQKWKKKILI